MIGYNTILDRLISKDIFCAVVNGDNTAFYVSDFLANLLEVHADADVCFPINTPAVWNRFADDEYLEDDPELQEVAASLAHIQAELFRLEHTDKQEAII